MIHYLKLAKLRIVELMFKCQSKLNGLFHHSKKVNTLRYKKSVINYRNYVVVIIKVTIESNKPILHIIIVVLDVIFITYSFLTAANKESITGDLSKIFIK